MNVLRFLFMILFGTLASIADPTLAQAPADDELLALRFYIREGNEPAVNSEIRRLQLEYPDWNPPANLADFELDKPAVNTEKIYRHIEKGEYILAREAITEMSQKHPGWSPSEALLQELAISEAQTRFTTAVEDNAATSAIRIARANPNLLRCERVNNAWLLAEQYIATDQNVSALDIYRSVLRSCTDADLLVATLEKSASIASVQDLTMFSDLARQQAPRAAERITKVEARLLAGLGVTSPDVTTQKMGADSAEKATAVANTRPQSRPSGLNTTGRSSISKSPASSGHIASRSNASLSQIRSAANRGDWRRCLELSSDVQSGPMLSQRGWCALNVDRPMQALNDFRRAAGLAKTAPERQDSHYGMAITMLQLDMVDQAAQIASSTNFDKRQRLDIESQILDKRGVMAYNREEYKKAIAYIDEYERLTKVIRRDLAMLRGYAYLNSNQQKKAAAEFSRLNSQMSTPASRRALIHAAP